MSNKEATYMRYLLGVVAAVFMAACASIGRPNGGEYDVEPPVYVKSEPAIGGINVNRNRITIDFNENVQVEDAMNRVVVSPAQKTLPTITANGRRITVDIRDTLRPNTTYTIDFSDAIRDLNEGNVLDGFSVDFSTGGEIDSLRISGMVFEARTLEPAQGILVGVYSNLADSAISTLPFERIARTNQLGQFTLRGLRPVDYRIFAVNDINRDYHWDRSEDIAIYDTIIRPWVETVTVTDSLRTASGGDSLVTRTAREFYPNDVLLTWFNEGYKAQYLKDYKRPERRKLTVNFGAHSDTLPVITLLNGQQAGMKASQWARLNTVATLDTLEYFITDSAVLAQDSMLVEMRYLRTDTNERLVWGADTLRFNFKDPVKSKGQLKKEAKEREKRIEEIMRRKLEAGDSTPIQPSDTIEIKYLQFSSKTSGSQEMARPILFTVEEPLTVDTIPASAVKFAVMRDSVWEAIAAPPIYRADPYKLLGYRMDYDWKPATKYQLSIDSAAIHSIYGLWNKPLKYEFQTKATEEYSALYVNVSGLAPTDSAYVELLSRDDKPVVTNRVVDGTAEFTFVNPGDYYLRLFVDRNGNGKWDAGNVAAHEQPEDVYYYPKKVVLKKNWDVEQSWNIYETAIDLQKPLEIKKNKPKENKKRRRRPDGSYIDDEPGMNRNGEEEDDGYGENTNPFGGNGPARGNALNGFGRNANTGGFTRNTRR